MRQLWAVMRKEFLHMERDVWATAILTVGAAILLVLLAYTFSAEVKDLPVAVLDWDKSALSRSYLERFQNEKLFELRYHVESYEEVERMVKRGKAKAALVILPDFGESIQASRRGQAAEVQLIVDGTEPNTAYRLLGTAEALSANFSADLLQQNGLINISLPLVLRVRARYDPDLRAVNTMLPGLMAVILGMPAMSLAASLTREKEQSTLEGMLATPIRRYQLLLGKLVPYVGVGLLDVILFSAIGIFGFSVPFRGRVADLFLLSGLFLLANLGIGLLVSALVSTQRAAIIITFNIFVLPPFIQSGLLFPIYSMPPELQVQASLIPATHYIAIARGLFLKGVGVEVLWPHALYLLAFGLVLNALAIRLFQNKLG